MSMSPSERELHEAATALYDAGHWSCDRPVSENAMWMRLRGALGRASGGAPKPAKTDDVTCKKIVTLKGKDYEVEFQVTGNSELVVTIRVSGEYCMKPVTGVVTQVGNPVFNESVDTYRDLIRLLTKAAEDDN